MSKNKKISPSNPGPLFDWVKKAQELSSHSSSPAHGSLDCDSELRAAVSADIKACRFSRYQIAARMSELAAQEITQDMLYSWTADSKEKHRFPCQFLPAFVVATEGQRRVFEVLSRRSGLFALPGPEALKAEIHQINEEIQRLREERDKRKLFLKEIDR